VKPDPEGPSEDRPMTLGEHLDELRKRVFVCLLIAIVFVGACFAVEEMLLGIALWPAQSVMRGLPGTELISIEVGEQFFSGMKVCIVAGLFFAAPLILYVLWGFVARGLHAHERRYVHVFAPVSYVLFLGGCLFFYFVIQPFTLEVLIPWHMDDIVGPGGEPIRVTAKLSIQHTISFFLGMTLVTGLFFELPLVMLFLQAIRVATWRTYVKYASHCVFGLVVISALITPTGDAFTLLVFLIPILILFAGGIVACRIMAPKDV
jgi:Tat protein translocase TatC